MNFVLDSSLALAFVFEDEASPDTDRILDRLGQGSIALVPALWRWDVANALAFAERRGRITPAQVQRHLTHLQCLPTEVDERSTEEAWKATCGLARKHGLTVYDAAYLEMAVRHGVPLASLDAELRAAGKAEGVPLLPPKRVG